MLVLISESSAEAEVEGLTTGESVEFQSRTYSRWQGSQLDTNDTVSIIIRKSFMSGKNIQLIIPVVVFVLVLGAGVFYNLVYKKRKKI